MLFFFVYSIMTTLRYRMNTSHPPFPVFLFLPLPYKCSRLFFLNSKVYSSQPKTSFSDCVLVQESSRLALLYRPRFRMRVTVALCVASSLLRSYYCVPLRGGEPSPVRCRAQCVVDKVVGHGLSGIRLVLRGREFRRRAHSLVHYCADARTDAGVP